LLAHAAAKKGTQQRREAEEDDDDSSQDMGGNVNVRARAPASRVGRRSSVKVCACGHLGAIHEAGGAAGTIAHAINV
jgi:hypothetical protein